MKPTLHLTKANFRKGKDLTFIFIIILAIAAMLLELGIITVLDYKQNFYDRTEQLRTPDSVFTSIMDDTVVEQFTADLEKDERTTSVYHYPIQYVFNEFQYGDGIMASNITVLPLETFQSGNDFELLESMDGIQHPVYLPYIFKEGGGYQLGDTFTTISTLHEDLNYQVAGFYDSFLLGSVNNGVVSIALPNAEFETMANAFEHQKDGYLIGSKITDIEELDAYCSSYTDHLKTLQPDGAIITSTNVQVTMSARTITSDIGSYLILIFSFIVSAVAVLMIHYRIRNSVEENSTNIGALKAMGYTNAQVRNASILQFSVIGFIGTSIGCWLGYLTLPLLSNIYSVQTGMKWIQGFDGLATLLTFAFLEGCILLTCLFATRCISHLSVLRALRFGIATHNFKSNPIPLSKQGPLSILLGLKLLCHHRAQAIVVAIIAFMISFCGIYTGTLSFNFVAQNELVINSLMGEKADVRMNLAGYDLGQAKQEIDAMEQVNQVLYYTQIAANFQDRSIMLNITDDYENLTTEEMIYEGRYPKYDDEIAIHGLMAKENGKEVGDEIEITYKGSSKNYLITGLVQTSNYMGYDVYLRSDAIRLLDSAFQPDTLYVYGNDKTSADALKTALEEKYDAYGVRCSSFEDQIQAGIGVFQVMIVVITQLVALISIALIFLILYLMIETILVQKRQSFGVQKAIGYTTKQLQLQVAISFLPQIIIGSSLGCISAYFLMNPICGMLFSSFGWMRVSFVIPWYLLVGIIGSITIIAFVLAMFLTRKIRNITPYTLLTE